MTSIMQINAKLSVPGYHIRLATLADADALEALCFEDNWQIGVHNLVMSPHLTANITFNP